jgi:hypothetical protein
MQIGWKKPGFFCRILLKRMLVMYYIVQQLSNTLKKVIQFHAFQCSPFSEFIFILPAG